MTARRNIIHDYSIDEADRIFRQTSFRFSLIFVIVTVSISIFMLIIVNGIVDIFRYDRIEFSADDSTQTVYSCMEDGFAGDAVRVRVLSCVHSDGKVTLSLQGENRSGNALHLDGSAFMLSSFNSHAAETRNHYYPDDWKPLDIPDGGAFDLELTYSLDSPEKMLHSDYIFTLSAFRASRFPTLEIVLHCTEHDDDR